MSVEKKPNALSINKEGQSDAEKKTLEEFSIVELEDRLEFLLKCDNNCKCPAQP